MQDDGREKTVDGTVSEGDVLGELIRAAGRRPSPPREDYEQVRAASREAWQEKVSARRRRRRNFALAAGIAAVAAGATTLIQIMPRGAPPAIASTAVLDETPVMVLAPGSERWEVLSEDARLVPGTRLRTPAQGRVSLDLQKGISLRINTESELLLASVDRVELAAGTVYVDSGSGARTNRFEVETPFGTIRDIGTQFEVRSSPAALRVRVREGLVELYRDRQEPVLSGTAGEEVRVDSVGAIQRAPFSTYDPEWTWASTLADVPQTDGQPLLGFLNWVARETGRSLRFSGPGAEAQAQTTILHGNTPRLAPLEALGVMLATTDFEYTLLEDGVLFIQRRELAGQ